MARAAARVSLRLRLVNLFLRLFEKPYLAWEKRHTRARRRLRFASRFFLGPWRARYHETELAGLPAIEARCDPAGPGTLLWFHGGAFVLGSRRTHRKLAGALACEGACRVLLPDYRLAPEHPFPAAQDDALACYRALLRDCPADSIAIGGDSAGGGLAFSLLHAIGAEGLPKPACILAFSPWTDLTLGSPWLERNARADPMLPASRMREVAALVLAGADARDPLASPVFGAFDNPPPALIQVGDSEILRGDAEAMAERLKASGGEVALQIWRGTPHVWQIIAGWLPEADAALEAAGVFLRRNLPQR